jgi:hypothetical protein
MTEQRNVSTPNETQPDPETAYKLARLHWNEAISLFLWLLIAIVTFICFMVEDGTRLSKLGGVFFMLATIMFVRHCCSVAKRKWDTPTLGFIGLLPVIGIIILILIPGRKTRRNYHAERRKKLASWR